MVDLLIRSDDINFWAGKESLGRIFPILQRSLKNKLKKLFNSDSPPNCIFAKLPEDSF